MANILLINVMVRQTVIEIAHVLSKVCDDAELDEPGGGTIYGEDVLLKY